AEHDGVGPQVQPAPGAAELERRRHPELLLDDPPEPLRLLLLVQGKNDLDSGRDVRLRAVSDAAVPQPASEQVAELAIDLQLVVDRTLKPSVLQITVDVVTSHGPGELAIDELVSGDEIR